jgi:hypothetical protein
VAILALSCTCGTLAGTLRDAGPRTVNHVRCYCDDCQTYAFFLGRPDDVLDASGGTVVLQTTPSRVKLEAGADQLRCVRLGPRGPYRFYAGCCRTPVANVLPDARMPFAGVVRPFVAADDAAIEEVVGPVRRSVRGRYATGPVAENTDPDASVGVILRAMSRMAGGWLKGAARPTPFFDGDAPVTEPQLLTRDERRAHREAAAGRRT